VDCKWVSQATAGLCTRLVRDESNRSRAEAMRKGIPKCRGEAEIEWTRYESSKIRIGIGMMARASIRTFLTEEGRVGHFGLQASRERAQVMGGKLTVWSAATQIG